MNYSLIRTICALVIGLVLVLRKLELHNQAPQMM